MSRGWIKIKHLTSNESGQTLVLTALCAFILISLLGLAIDVGQLRYAKRKLQVAADASALAAGLELRVCGNIANCPAMQIAAQQALQENGYTGSTVTTNCSTSNASLTLMVATPTCSLGAKDPNTGKKGYVEVQLTQKHPTYFARLIGLSSITLSARAEATRKPGAPCIYALDPSGPGAISIIAGLIIYSACGIVDESTSPLAFSCLIGAFIYAPSIAITGGAGGLLCGVSHRVRTGVPPPTPKDPLAYLPRPTPGACGTRSGNQFYGSNQQVNILLAGQYVFHPGVYCGGITMTATLLADITFEPGLYILKEGPIIAGVPGITVGGLALTISLLSSIQGSGVTFYNAGTVGGFSILAPSLLNLSNVSFTAPTNGTFSGILFYQDPSNTSPGVFTLGLLQGSKFEGAIYLPNAAVSYGVNAISADYNILVAKDINFTVAIASVFGNNYSSLDAGSPLDGDAAVLIQ